MVECIKCGKSPEEVTLYKVENEKVKGHICEECFKQFSGEAFTQISQSNELKNIGIVCDKYKQSKYETRLKKSGFGNYRVFDFKPGVKQIHVYTIGKNLPRLKAIVDELEIYFKARRN